MPSAASQAHSIAASLHAHGRPSQSASSKPAPESPFSLLLDTTTADASPDRPAPTPDRPAASDQRSGTSATGASTHASKSTDQTRPDDQTNNQPTDHDAASSTSAQQTANAPATGKCANGSATLQAKLDQAQAQTEGDDATAKPDGTTVVAAAVTVQPAAPPVALLPIPTMAIVIPAVDAAAPSDLTAAIGQAGDAASAPATNNLDPQLIAAAGAAATNGTPASPGKPTAPTPDESADLLPGASVPSTQTPQEPTVAPLKTPSLWTVAPRGEKVSPGADGQRQATAPSKADAGAPNTPSPAAATDTGADSNQATTAPVQQPGTAGHQNKPANSIAGLAAPAGETDRLPGKVEPNSDRVAVDASRGSDTLSAIALSGQANAPIKPAAATPAPTALQDATSVVTVPFAGLAVAIATRAQADTNQFEIRLDPPELGRIKVSLQVDSQGNVTSHLVVDRAQTLDLLRRDAPQLERALQDAGLKTGDNAMQFSLSDQSLGPQQQNSSSGFTHVSQLVIPDEDASLINTNGGYVRTVSASGVDIRV